MTSKRCKKIVSKTVSRMKKHGKGQRQAVAIGLNTARTAGCRIRKK